MRISDRNLKQLCREKTALSCEEAAIAKTVRAAKCAYYQSEAEAPLFRWEFVFQQAKFIRKYWWLLQALVLLGLWAILKYSESGSLVQRSIALFSPLFVVLILPELWKNRSADAMEVECCTRFGLRQIYAARMLLFGIVDLAMLTVFFLASSSLGRLTAAELVIQFFLPFNVTACICFRTLYSRAINSEALALLLCVVWSVLWAQIVYNQTIYQAVTTPVWAALLTLSAGYLVRCIHKGQRVQIYEVKPLWN